MGRTLFDRIWDAHLVTRRADGRDLLYIDRHLVHELHAPHAFEELTTKGHAVRRRDLTLVVQDHTVPTLPGAPLRSAHIDATRIGASRHGVAALDPAQPEHGIVHVVSPELGLALPGLTLACPDSHASTVGALGCLAFGCGTSELVHVLATQVMALARPRQMRVRFDGPLGPGVGAKDMALALIRQLGTDAGRGYAVEYAGDAVASLDIEGRMTLCNMTIEWGARTCLVAPDAQTIAWVKGRPGAPTGAEWDEAVRWWSQLRSDDDAVFDREVVVDCTAIAPYVTWGTDPGQAIAIGEPVPVPQATGSETASARAQAALAYMDVQPGRPLAGLPVQRVFIGSCSNSRLPDLRRAAAIAKGRHVAPGVRAIVVPGSSTVKRDAEREGLDRVFLDAGFEWHNAGCSMCAGANGDVAQAGERVVSTSNRNFENRQGRGVRTHLAGPEMAAAAAIAGHIVDVRELLAKD